MMSSHLVDATGVIALSLNLSGMLGQNDRHLLKTSGWASAVWAVNNLLLGAPTAAALSALSVARQASAAALQQRSGRLKAGAFAGLVMATLMLAAWTWEGSRSLYPAAGSLLVSYAMFYLRGASLRWAMVLANLLWMHNALAVGAWWQLAAGALAGGAAAVGAWRARARDAGDAQAG